MPPDLAIENECIAETGGPVCGIDEAGRGPWAGPVVAAAVILDQSAIPEGINDSKRLSAKKRAALFEAITETAQVGVGIGTVAEIEELNILRANDLAMARALATLSRAPVAALIDGKWRPRTISIPMRTIIGGDARSLSIAAASIIAKVTRDRIMVGLDAGSPEYGWARNAGYGTQAHRDALLRLGVTPHHRRTWAPIRKLLDATMDKPAHEK